MQTRKLGWTDLELSTIGLGTWAIGGGGWQFSWGAQDDRESIQTIQRALDLGINWIDTAAVYGLGHSEEVVGQAIQGLSTKPLIATKCSRVWDENRSLSGSLKPASLRREVEASLRRLNLETIDLFQIHWPIPDEDIEAGWSTLRDFVTEGKVRYIGVCNFNRQQLERIQPIHPVASLQPPYSMLRRDVEKELLEYCAAHQIGVVAYSPMQKGLLTGKFTLERARALPEDDHRKRDVLFQEPQLSRILRFVEQLKPIAASYGMSVAQLAIAWTLRRPEVTSAIVGARHPSQIEETVAAGDERLSAEDAVHIDALLGALSSSN